MKSRNITFIGGGNMATSLINGLVADGYDPKRIIVSDTDHEKLSRLAARLGIHTRTDNQQAVREADVVVLAVKPQILEVVACEIASAVQQRNPLVISIAAGVKEEALRKWLGDKVTLVRSMPNTPAMIQAGATGMHAGRGVSKEQQSLAESILRAVGITCWVSEESLMDAVTAVSGSGTAYFFMIMEVMEEAARGMGLNEETARLLTLQTALGAARMAMESQDSPGTLRNRVTSPGGTTERALNVLEQAELRAVFARALEAARDRSEELSNILGNPKKLNRDA